MSLRVCVVYKQGRLEMLKFCTGEREYWLEQSNRV
jgi:hypothetical protein